MLSHGIMVVTAMDGLTTVATITERDLPTPNQLQLLMLMPRLSHGGTHTTDTHGHTMVMPITERGLLMLMPSLSLGGTAATDTDGHTMVMPITERGQQTLNQPPMLMPSQSHGGTEAMDTVGHTTVTTGVKLA